ncbi:MAG: CPBP family intramembrane metalloprotease [Treponema sp.]|nr:CPBP family intramembrane metalloprotease [Treponema sp.]
MNKKLVFQFLLLTFSIMIFSWGLLVLLGQLGILANDHFWLFIPFMIGGFSPTIASYIALKWNNEITGLKEWIKNIFTVKIHIKYYIFTILLYSIIPVMFILLPPGLEKMEPIYMFLAFLPIMVIGGGLEEAGWRYILQPELEKKFKFIISTIIIAPIWAVWHLPLFFIPSAVQYETNFGIFTIGVIGLSFAIAAIRRITGSVFLCVLFHSMVNAGFSTFIITQTLYRNIIMTIILIILSVMAVFIYEKNVSRMKDVRTL